MIRDGRRSRSSRSLALKAVRALLAVVSTLLACFSALLGVLLAWSYPGRPKRFIDETGKPLPRSISEKVFVTINGMQQGMFIKSKDARHPVLLYLHGGMPEYFLGQKYPTGLEDHFTVVWWEQRGAGLSYRPDVPPETMTVKQFIEDTLALTQHLCSRFRKEKIYLMAHSGGTSSGYRPQHELRIFTTPTSAWPRWSISSNQKGERTRTCSSALGRTATGRWCESWRPHQSLLTEYRRDISTCATRLCTVSGSAPCGK